MMVRRLVMVVVGLLAVVAPAAGADLKVGDPAPKLAVARFVKGEPVKAFEPGKVYVVEFWATWCGPCRESIPHLTALQKRYKDVAIIGVSVAETDPADVEPFVKKMGDTMDYRVAADEAPGAKEGEGGKMLATWMEAAGQDGIPTAFIVDPKGRIAWIGGPTELDGPLAKVVRGELDVDAEKAKGQDEAALRAKLDALGRKLAAAGDDSDAAIRALDEAIRDEPALEPRVGLVKFGLMAGRDDLDERAAAYGRHLVAGVLPANPTVYAGMAWLIVDPDRAPKAGRPLVDFALEVARKADEAAGGKDVAAADSLARALFLKGEAAKALAAQERALKLAAGTEMEGDEGLEARLDEYRRAAAKPR